MPHATHCCCCSCFRSTEEDNKPKDYRLKAQVAIITVISLIGLNHGMSISHAAVLIPQVQAENSTLQIDEDDSSWIASVYSFASPLGSFIGGILAETIGRRTTIMIALGSIAIGWITIFLSQSSWTIMIARILEGISKTMAITALTVLVDETAHPTFRGFNFAHYDTMMSVGIFTMMGLATLMNWRMSSIVACAFSVLSCMSILTVAESPTWLVRKDCLHKAEQALHHLLGHSRQQQTEETLLNLRKRYTTEGKTPNSFLQRIIICKKTLNKNFLKPFLIIHAINVFIQMFCGNHLVINYSVDMVSHISEHYDPYNITTMLSLIRTLACLVVGFTLTLIGRRTFMMISGVGSTISSVILAALLFPDLGSQITPEVKEALSIALLGIYVASFSSGYLIIPAMMIGETQPATTRGILCGYIYTINDFTAGAIVKMYPWLLRTLGLHGMFLMFGVACMICALFAYLFLPETQGKTLEEIEDYFKQKNIMWITRKKNIPKVHCLSEEAVDFSHQRESLIEVT